MTNRKIRDYQRNRKLKGIVDANFKTFATVAIALKQLFPHDWYNKTITDFTSSYAEFTAHMNSYDAEAYDFHVEDSCRKLNISDSDTYDIIFKLNGKLPAEIFLALQNNLKCMLIHLRLNCSIGSQRYAKLIAYLKSDAKICGQADLTALGLSFDDDIDYRKLKSKTEQPTYSDGIKAQQILKALKAYQDEVIKCQQQLSSKSKSDLPASSTHAG